MTTKLTPMMAQWHACKRVAKDALLFFRMGDFYEAFYDDAVIMARELDLTLTKRQEIPMAGVPWQHAEGYIDKLVSKGHKVAVAEQIEDPKQTTKLVRREVVRIVTPGTLVGSAMVPEKANNYFGSLAQVGSVFGLSIVDLSTGEFCVCEFEERRPLFDELHRLGVAELLVSDKFHERHSCFLEGIPVTTKEEWHFDHQMAHDFLIRQFKVHSLDGFGLKGMVAAVNAAGGLLAHLSSDLRMAIDHLTQISPYSTAEYMSLDRMTQRNLELTEALHEGTTLLQVIDRTETPMGGRRMRHWIKQPLLAIEPIQTRQKGVQALLDAPFASQQLQEALGGVRDLERLIMKVSAGMSSPRDMVALRRSFEQLPVIKATLSEIEEKSLQQITSQIEDLSEVASLIGSAIVDEPPARLSDGGIFREGHDPELDELLGISRNSKQWLADYQAHLRESADIKNLRVGYNRVFGYYIEVSKGQADRMPESFQRRQTLVNAERFISPELKEYEAKVLTAQDRIGAIEGKLFALLREQVAAVSDEVLKTANALAQLDCLNSLACVAREQGYVCPEVDSSDLIEIEEGRHPVIEAGLIGQKFIPNDTQLDLNDQQLVVLTGPNMAGKSTYIRQVALIVILAQMGSFVPAEKARIGVVDKVFTRIGASDDLSRGQSTFMVEMTETANILNNCTSRSLVILDEIGRGTSTYDGVSIAWSVAEYLLTTAGKKARTLFATHYYELTELEDKVPGAINYNVAVHDHAGEVLFLHKIVRGAADKSYGIHVAQLAGLPMPLIARAQEILAHLEGKAAKQSLTTPKQKMSEQLSLF